MMNIKKIVPNSFCISSVPIFQVVSTAIFLPVSLILAITFAVIIVKLVTKKSISNGLKRLFIVLIILEILLSVLAFRLPRLIYEKINPPVPMTTQNIEESIKNGIPIQVRYPNSLNGCGGINWSLW